MSYSQSAEIDSLRGVLSNHKVKDTTYVNVINDIAFDLIITDPQEAIYYINLAISVAKDLDYEEGVLRATTIKGNSFLVIGMPDQALSYYLEALSYNPEKYPLQYARLSNNIGEVYRRKEVYDSSIKYFNRALKIAQENVKEYKPVIIYSNLGEVSLMQGDLHKAKYYFNKCLKNAISEDHLRGKGYGNFGLAECAFLEDKVDLAILLMHNSVKFRNQALDQRGVAQSYLRLGSFFNTKQKNSPDSALHYWMLSADLSTEHETYDLLSEVYSKLYNFHLDRLNIEAAAKYLDLHKNLADSIRNAEFISNVGKMKSALKTELVNAENELLKQEKLQRESEEDARLIVISLAFLIVLGLAITTYQHRQRQLASNEATSEQKFTQTLLLLSNKLNESDFNLSEFIEHLLEMSRVALEVDRATFRRYDEHDDSLNINSKVESDNAEGTPVVDIHKQDIISFFDEFLTNRTIAITNISNESRLSDIYESYFKSVGIESVLCGPVLIDGKFEGFISYAMINNIMRTWSIQEQRYVASLADLIFVALEKRKGNILRREKEELISKLKTRNKSLNEFNSVISHNLREPLTQIIGLSEILKDENHSNGDSQEIINRISDSSNKVDKVIKELSIILSENEPKPSDFRLLSLEKLIKEVLDLLKNDIKSQNVTIEQVLETSKIRSYKPYLSDALYHILSNSIKFANPSKRLHINIRSYEDEFKQYLVVTDNGRGMDLEKFGDKIFKMYQRYHIDVEGRGIGLFIVKNRINVLNGIIDVESKEGEGTSFMMTFPKYYSSLN